jgi:hypothetical protein
VALLALTGRCNKLCSQKGREDAGEGGHV